MHTVFALLCFVVVIHWLIFPYPSDLLHWHCGNLTIAPVPAKQPWWIWINTSCEFITNDCITTTKQSTTKPCAYFLGYTVYRLCVVKCDNIFVHPMLCTKEQTPVMRGSVTCRMYLMKYAHSFIVVTRPVPSGFIGIITHIHRDWAIGWCVGILDLTWKLMGKRDQC